MSADHAMGITSLNDAIKKAGPGGEVRLIADTGVFKVTKALDIYSGGTDGASVTVRS